MTLQIKIAKHIIQMKPLCKNAEIKIGKGVFAK